MQGLGQEFYALGNTKILMMPEARSVVDACKKKASEKFDCMAMHLKRAFTTLAAPTVHKRKIRAILFI